MSTLCFFVSDLHGKKSRYEKLFRAIETQQPEAIFLEGESMGLWHYIPNQVTPWKK